MEPIKRLIHEAHRRSLWQVLGIYLGASWATLQIVDRVTTTVGLPAWVSPLAMVLLILGLPVVLATAFVQDHGGSKAPGDASAPSNYSDSSLRGEIAAGAGRTTATSAQRRPVPGGGVASSRLRRLLTWRHAILGGVGAFALLGVITAGYLISRATGVGPVSSLIAQGVLDERSRLIMARFEGPAEDSTVADAAAEALRADLSESPNVTIAEPEFVRDALARMRRPADTRLTMDVAREIAERTGLAGVVGGQVSAVGSGFVLTARLVEPDSGRVLASARETAADPNHVIPAIDRLSKALREKIGESYRSLRAGQPLERVTTSSLEALRKYSEAVRACDIEGDCDRAKVLLHQAIGLDSTFAMAYLELSWDSDLRSEWVAYDERAYELRDRLTDRERSLTTAFRQQDRGDIDGAVATLRALLGEHPGDGRALTVLAGLYLAQGRFEEAEQAGMSATRAPSCGICAFEKLAMAQAARGEWDAVDSTIARMGVRLEGNPYQPALPAWVLSGRREFRAAEVSLDSAQSAGSLQQGPARTFASAMWSEIAAATGRYAAAVDTLEGLLAAARTPLDSLQTMEEMARFQLAAGNTSPARALLASAVGSDAFSRLDPLDRPYLSLASTLSEAGRPAEAERLLAERAKEVPERYRTSPDRVAAEHRARGLIALARGQDGPAAAELRKGLDPGQPLMGLVPLGRALEASGDTAGAIDAYQRYVDRPSLSNRTSTDVTDLGPSYLALSRLYAARGDTAKAGDYGRKLADLWSEADAPLRARARKLAP